jgi:hypothetical protein
VVTFSFVDPGLLSLASFDTHLLAYGRLFSAVPRMDFVYIATRPTHFEVARGLFQVMAPRVTSPDPGVEGLHYFHCRYLWESKQYGKLTTDQIAFLEEATKRFTDPRIETLFQPWMHGQITCDVVTGQFRKLAPKRELSFRTELVDGQTTLFEANLAGRGSQKAEKEEKGVKCDEPSTFSPAFRSAFEREAQQSEEN